MTQTDDLVTVATFDVPMAASVVKNALTAEGIPAVVTDADVATVLPSEAVHGAKVQVPAAFAAQAALRIAAMDAAHTDDEGGSADDEELARQALSQPRETE